MRDAAVMGTPVKPGCVGVFLGKALENDKECPEMPMNRGGAIAGADVPKCPEMSGVSPGRK